MENQINGYVHTMADRKQQIVEYIYANGFAKAEELAGIFDVSAITVRRDLTGLEESNHIRRVHGGAIPGKASDLASPISNRLRQRIADKREIARYAATLISNGEKLFLDAGSTCHYLAEELPAGMNLIVITHSLDIVNILSGRNDLRVIAVGGELDVSLQAFVGPVAENQIGQFLADRAFLNASSVEPESGCHTNTMIESNLKCAMIRQSKESYILVDGSKFDESALYPAIPISEIRKIITTADENHPKNPQLRARGIEVICLRVPANAERR